MPPIPGSLDENGDFVEPKSLAKSIDNAMLNKPDFGQLQWRPMLIGFATGFYQNQERLNRRQWGNNDYLFE